MTGRVRIRLHSHLIGDDGENGAVANIYPVEHREDAARTHRGIVIPVGGTSQRTVNLEEGGYLIEAMLPSGEIVSEDVQVKAGASVDVDLNAGYSEYEWLGWQHFLGNVAEANTYAPARDAALLLEESAAPKPEVYWVVTQPDPFLGTDGGAWSVLANATGGTVVVEEGLHTSSPLRISPVMEDALVRLYRLEADGPLHEELAEPGRSTLPDEARRYVLVQSADGVRVVTVPLPWMNVDTGRQVAVEALVRVAPGEPAVSLAVRDPVLGSALGYMTLGALPAAAQLFDLARDMLYGKMTNPLAAAGGGYVLLATEQGSEAKPWHAWIENLKNLFEWLPDGAIQFGWLKLRHRRSDGDVRQAREALFTAYHRGVPFYSVGLRWLLDGLTLLAPNDPEATAMLENVRRVAWRVSVGEPFTIIKLPA